MHFVIILSGFQLVFALSYIILVNINLKKTMERIFTIGFIPMWMTVSAHLYMMWQFDRHDFGLSMFIIPFMLLLSWGRNWYEFLIYSIILWVSSILLVPWIFSINSTDDYSSFKYSGTLLLVLAAFTIIYSFWEKVLKELWVISDSNKKSFGIFRNILECQVNHLLTFIR